MRHEVKTKIKELIIHKSAEQRKLKRLVRESTSLYYREGVNNEYVDQTYLIMKQSQEIYGLHLLLRYVRCKPICVDNVDLNKMLYAIYNVDRLFDADSIERKYVIMVVKSMLSGYNDVIAKELKWIVPNVTIVCSTEVTH